MTKRFTGWHMAIIIVAFFAVVIAVNATMATYAARTFGGTVVDNSYVASQQFNAWLSAARAQQTYGWQARSTLRDDRRLEVDLEGDAGPLAGAQVQVHARHTLGAEPDTALTMREVGPGRYVSEMPLPSGRWQLFLTVRADGREARMLETL